ncbi:MAG: hypothetical protein O7D94_12340, partial [Planctomycetota bacterium]|nr:hypothetical protein [Planctomycetota bacterium]
EFLMQLGSNAYLWSGSNGIGRIINVVDVKTGKSIKSADAGVAEFAAAARADQSILLVSRGGEMMCLRSAKAPHLAPAALVSVLKNDRMVKQLRRGAPKKDVVAPPRERLASVRYRFLMEDWFSSRSTAKPVGGRGLVEIEEEEEDEDLEDEDEFDDDEDMDDEEDDEEEEDEDGEDEDEDDWEEDDEDWEEDDEDWEEDDEDEEDDEEDDDESDDGSKGSSGGVRG